jgi:hypothetical protein
MSANGKRWLLLALNGILWVGTAKLIDAYIQNTNFYSGVRDVIVLMMVAWLNLVGLQALWVLYREIRERLMRWAIEQAQPSYRRDADDKRKRDQAALMLADDGELVDFPFRFDTDKRSNDER